MLRRNILLVARLGCSIVASAQMERTIYQIFEVDSARTITLDLAGLYEVQAWAGGNILAETNIQIWNASPEILSFLIKEGRYELVGEKVDGGMDIYTKDRNRKPIKTKHGEATEIATAKIFVPDFYTWTKQDNLTVLQRKN